MLKQLKETGDKVKLLAKEIGNTPVPLSKAVVVSGILIIASVVTTHRIKMIIVVH